MRTIAIKDISTLLADEIVESMTGRITKIDKQDTGHNDYGDFKFQILTVGGIAPDTGSTKVYLKDREAIEPTMLGKVISISCTTSGTGMKGVKVKDKKVDGKVEREVSVTKVASITFPEDGAPAQTAEPTKTGEPKAKTEPATKKTEPQSPSVGHEIGRRRHLLARCIVAAHVTGREIMTATNGELQLSEESIRSMGTTLYIDCAREGLHKDLDHTFTLKQLPKPTA